jgi:hypothetical protein
MPTCARWKFRKASASVGKSPVAVKVDEPAPGAGTSAIVFVVGAGVVAAGVVAGLELPPPPPPQALNANADIRTAIPNADPERNDSFLL